MSTLLCGFYVRARHVGPEGCWTYVGVAYQQADMRMNQQPLSHWFTHWMSINDICCRRRCHALQPLVHSILYIVLQVGRSCCCSCGCCCEQRESCNAQLSMTARAHHNPKLSLSLITHPCCVRTQICGAIFGSLLAAALVPGASINMGPDGPGCFGHMHPEITRAQHFGWVRPRNALITLACLAVAVPPHKPVFVLVFTCGCCPNTCHFTGGDHDLCTHQRCVCVWCRQARPWQLHTAGSRPDACGMRWHRRPVHWRSTQPRTCDW
jgi:hypothetical protein